MKRLTALLLFLCLFLGACGDDSGELEVHVQREAIVTAEALPEPVTETATVPTTEYLTGPATEPTQAAATAPTEIAATEILTEPPLETEVFENSQDYVLNKNTRKFHYPHCSSVSRMKAKNRLDYHGSRDEILSKGYEPCKNCDP